VLLCWVGVSWCLKEMGGEGGCTVCRHRGFVGVLLWRRFPVRHLDMVSNLGIRLARLEDLQ
jgi:hypothetical protein